MEPGGSKSSRSSNRHMTFLEYLEKTCPGDDAHDGWGDKRPLLERCATCEELYKVHMAEVKAERERCAIIAEEFIRTEENLAESLHREGVYIAKLIRKAQ
jgi:hypothetical protein